MHNLPILYTLLVIAVILGSSLSVTLPQDLYQHRIKHSKRSRESFLGVALAEAENSHTVEESAHVAQVEIRDQAAGNHPGLGPEHGALALRDTDGQHAPIQASEPVRFAFGDNHPSPGSQADSGYNPESDNDSGSVESERSREVSHSNGPSTINPQHNSDYERARRLNVFLGDHHNFSPQHHSDHDSDEYEVRSWSHGMTTSEAEEIDGMPMFDRDSDHSQSPRNNQNGFSSQDHSESERSELSYSLSPRSVEPEEIEATISGGQE